MSTAAYSAIVKANERAQAAARDAGRATFPLDVLECWPGCVECGHKIRARLDATGPRATHRCNCPGVTWSTNYGAPLGESPWVRHDPTPQQPPVDPPPGPEPFGMWNGGMDETGRLT